MLPRAFVVLEYMLVLVAVYTMPWITMWNRSTWKKGHIRIEDQHRAIEHISHERKFSPISCGEIEIRRRGRDNQICLTQTQIHKGRNATYILSRLACERRSFFPKTIRLTMPLPSSCGLLLLRRRRLSPSLVASLIPNKAPGAISTAWWPNPINLGVVLVDLGGGGGMQLIVYGGTRRYHSLSRIL